VGVVLGMKSLSPPRTLEASLGDETLLPILCEKNRRYPLKEGSADVLASPEVEIPNEEVLSGF